MTLRVMVVDDELPARQRLRKFLGQEPEVEIVGECASGVEALRCIQQQQPDLVFLDLRMPELNGLEVVRALPAEPRPAIVFVTAHDQHAVEAFEVQAADYLLKPFSQSRLQAAIRRVRQRLQRAPAARASRPADSPVAARSRFAVKDGNQTLFVKSQDVDYFEAAGNYVVICTPNGNHVLRETLRNLEMSLSPERFLRISRAVIVNLNRVKAIRSAGPGESLVVMEGGQDLLMTRGWKDVHERLQYSQVAESR